MSKEKDDKSQGAPRIYRHENHAQPVTRRDFLAQSVSGLSAFTVLPSLLSLVTARQVFGDDCSAVIGGASGMIPYLMFDCAGGAALSGNFVPHLDEGASSMLKAYGTLGLGTDPTAIGVDRSMGAPMASKGPFATAGNASGGSNIYAGIMASTTPEARAALRMAIICHTSQDDSSDNPLSALQMITQAGLSGSLMKVGIGNGRNVSGTNSRVPIDTPTLRPIRVQSYNDFQGALGYGPALQGQPKGVLDAIAKAIYNLSGSQKADLSRMKLGQQFATLAGCGYLKNQDYTAVPQGIDPRQNATLQKIYGITASSAANQSAVVSATIVMNVLLGNTGAGGITIGGCDYHTNAQTDGDTKDLEIGTQIGRAVQAAFELGKPLLFQLSTDGGLSSSSGTRNWAGDSGVRSMTVLGFVNPAGAPTLRKPQLGTYTNGEAVNQASSPVSASPQGVAAAVAANYLSLNNKLGLSSSVIPATILSATQIDQVILFG